MTALKLLAAAVCGGLVVFVGIWVWLVRSFGRGPS